MSNDDVGHSMIVALGLRRSRIPTKPINTTIGASQTLFMLSIPTRDPEVPATQAMGGLPPSVVEKNRLAQIRLTQKHRLMPRDLAIELAASAAFLKAG